MIYAEIALKIVVGLIGLVVVTRLLGKKEMSQVTPFDFIYALVLGGILEEGIYDKQVSIWQILFAICVWGISIYIIEVLGQKRDGMKDLLKGKPSLIICNGALDHKLMKKNHLDLEQLRTMLRKQGVFTLREVRDLYLEPGGDISVKLHTKSSSITPDILGLTPEDEAPSTLVIEEGKIKEKELQSIGKTKNWLLDELKKENHHKIKDIFYGEWSETNGFYIQTYSKYPKTK